VECDLERNAVKGKGKGWGEKRLEKKGVGRGEEGEKMLEGKGGEYSKGKDEWVKNEELTREEI
jgi:hypothetical protein